MKILSIDSTTNLGGAALLEWNCSSETITPLIEIPYDKTHGLGTGGQSQFLLPAVDRVLKETRTALDQIDLLSVVNGPGSFTGIRVGIAALKGLFHEEKVPVVEILSLDAMARAQVESQEQVQNKLLCPVIDARMGEVYAGLYRGAERMAGPWALSPEELIEAVGAAVAGEAPALFGTGVKPYGAVWTEHGWSSLDFFARSTTLAAAHRAVEKHRAGEALPITQLKPFYLRESEAERQWKRRHG